MPKNNDASDELAKLTATLNSLKDDIRQKQEKLKAETE